MATMASDCIPPEAGLKAFKVSETGLENAEG